MAVPLFQGFSFQFPQKLKLKPWHPFEATAIFAVVLFDATMGYIQESRAESAVAALKQMAAAQVNVIHDGAQRSIPSACGG